MCVIRLCGVPGRTLREVEWVAWAADLERKTGRAIAMFVEFLGQACVAISDGSHEIVCDPWFSGPAHLGSWHAVPTATPAYQRAMRERVERASHLYVSHDHADHFDLEWLRSLRPKTLLAANFRNRGFRELIESSGHQVRWLDSGESHALGKLELRIFPELPRCRTNSMLLVRGPLGALLNGNDCGLNTAMLQAIGGRERVRLFLYTLNFMANGFPFPYLHADDPELAKRVDEVRDQVLQSFLLAHRALRPERSAAFAGPVTFGDAINAHLNAHPEALDWSAMIDALRPEAEVWWPTPGARVVIDEQPCRLENQGSWPEIVTEHLRQAALWQNPPAPSRPVPEEQQLIEAGEKLIARLAPSLDAAPRQVGTALVLSGVDRLDQIESGPSRWSLRIDLDLRQLSLLREPHARPDAPPFLRIMAPHDVLLGFLRGEVTLDELLLSAHARFQRDPDTFNGTLHDLLRFGHDPESLAEVTRMRQRVATSRATIEVEVEGTRYTIPKFCPHEAESLELSTTCGHELTCPRHKWVFDLRTGQCVRVGDPTVNLYAQRGPSGEPST
jgi:UDP-MurNAc hydroxylase